MANRVINRYAEKGNREPGFRHVERKWESGHRKRRGARHIRFESLFQKHLTSFLYVVRKALLKASCLLLVVFGLLPFLPASLSGRASINGPVEAEGTLGDVSARVWPSDLSPSSCKHSALVPFQ